MKALEVLRTRKSVRKFKAQAIPKEDIQELLSLATQAPSGKNAQNWHFVVVSNPETIQAMAKAVEDRADYLGQFAETDKDRKFLKMVKYFTVFRNAPTVVMMFASGYPASGLELLKASGASSAEIHDLLRPAPGIQNVAAAMENFLLAAHAKGYGGCWMTGPNFAAKEMVAAAGIDLPGFDFVCMTPLGIPEESAGISPPRKPLEEVITWID